MRCISISLNYNTQCNMLLVELKYICFCVSKVMQLYTYREQGRQLYRE